MRPSGRKLNEMRSVDIETGVTKHAEGSCLIKMGDTHVLCTATIEDRVPSFIKGSGLGWVTAEYGMLPRSTSSRMRRESTAGKQGGRTVEIQRLIGRSLRAGVDRLALGERQITVDCDVIQADGGTRCASITGGWVALQLAVNKLLKTGAVPSTRYIESQVYQAVVENVACEQAAKMVAMKSATENAGELIDELELIMNNARQAAITQEISEIVSGAAAV